MEVADVSTGEVFNLNLTKRITLKKNFVTLFYEALDGLIDLPPRELKLILWLFRNAKDNVIIDISKYNADKRTVANSIVSLVKLDLIKRCTIQTGKRTIKKCYMINPDFGMKRFSTTKYFDLIKIWRSGDTPIVPFNLERNIEDGIEEANNA